MTFSSAVRCGNRLKRWNTIDTCVRIATIDGALRSTLHAVDADVAADRSSRAR